MKLTLTQKRTILRRFRDEETPLRYCANGLYVSDEASDGESATLRLLTTDEIEWVLRDFINGKFTRKAAK